MAKNKSFKEQFYDMAKSWLTDDDYIEMVIMGKKFTAYQVSDNNETYLIIKVQDEEDKYFIFENKICNWVEISSKPNMEDSKRIADIQVELQSIVDKNTEVS